MIPRGTERGVEILGATVRAPGGRVLFDGLDLRLQREHVALIGRNGVGKSTLLAVLAGTLQPSCGRVAVPSRTHYVPQALDEDGVRCSLSLSRGQRRMRALEDARTSGAELLLLDEPTEDLDEEGVAWLRGWLLRWRGGVVAASHDRRLLADFRDFLVASESGCSHLAGTLHDVEAELERAYAVEQERYARSLRRLAVDEGHTLHVERRRARKKRSGRCSEMDRATARIRLNAKRGQAQVSHGRAAIVREARLDALRESVKTTRHALKVELALDLPTPNVPTVSEDVLVLRDVAVRADDDGRTLAQGVHLAFARRRIAIVGPNRAGKTTLLDVMLGNRAPAAGTVRRRLSRIGVIAQGGTNWMLDESLLVWLSIDGRSGRSPEEIAKLVTSHRFPLALAERPMRSLSPGERTRAALLCLFQRTPEVELLILDEPTHGLDLLGQHAMTAALRAWPGGLVVASHDRAFLGELSMDDTIELGAA